MIQQCNSITLITLAPVISISRFRHSLRSQFIWSIKERINYCYRYTCLLLFVCLLIILFHWIWFICLNSSLIAPVERAAVTSISQLNCFNWFLSLSPAFVLLNSNETFSSTIEPIHKYVCIALKSTQTKHRNRNQIRT